jgi:hypothetical protein
MIDVDPCLFILGKVICLVYVDDTSLYARNMRDIDDVIRRLSTDEHKMTLEVEDNVAGFLGVHIDRNKETGEATLTQKGLDVIDRILEALQVEDLPPGMSLEDQYQSKLHSLQKCLMALLSQVRFSDSRNLYDKKAAPRLWFQHLRERLVATGFQQMIDVDPCLFISDKVICLLYVDDTLLYARDMKDIDDVIKALYLIIFIIIIQ